MDRRVKSRNAAIRATAYTLRQREGYGLEDSRLEAIRRVDRRDGLRYLRPDELTLDQCRLIGFWVGDGSVTALRGGGVEFKATQSITYPKIIEWFDKVIAGCGYDSVRRDNTTKTVPHISWSFPRGTGGGSQARNGLFEIEPYLNKDGSELLWGLDAEQFDAFLEGLWYADGEHGKAEHGYPRFWKISATRKHLLNLLQAIGTVRGMEMAVRPSSRSNRKENHSPLWILARAASVHHITAPTTFQPDPEPWKPEEVWCVKVTTKNIITRRNGAVTVMGNTEGWDAPWCDCILLGRPTQSKALFVQIVGRGLRPWIPGGKTDCLVLDLTGASERNQLATLADLGLDHPEEETEEEEESSTPDPDASDQFGDEKMYGIGPLHSRVVDLFASSRSLWLRTEDRGWWFIPVLNGQIFIYPRADGRFAVGIKQANRQAQVLEGKDPGLSFEVAMAWGERYAAELDTSYDLGFSINKKSANWRKGNRPANQAQRDYARDLGIDPEIVMSANKRDLSDLISIRVATRALRRVA